MEIKKTICLVISVFFLQCAAPDKSAKTHIPSVVDLTYVIEPVFTPENLNFNVDMYFRGNMQGEDKIILPSKWAGQNNLQQFIINLTILTPDTGLQSTEMENIKKITHKPGQMLHLRYQVVEVNSKNLINIQRLFNQKFRLGYFHFFGATFFIHPYWNILEKIKIAIDWKKLPENWQISSSFGTNVRSQIVTEHLFNLKYSLFLGGDYRTYRITISNNPIYVAIRGPWPFPDQEYLDLLTKIVSTQRNFWHDHNYPYFLITLAPTEATCCYYNGAAAYKAFTMVAPPKKINRHFIHLINHEFFHNWLGLIISNQKAAELTYWFFEGFSEYYARLLSLREGLISLKDYLDDLNIVLKYYHKSEVKKFRNSEVVWNFSHDLSMNKMPYYKGDLLAHFWNDAILQKSSGKQSLDNLMHELFLRTQSEGLLVSNQGIAELLKKYMKGDPAKDIRQYVETGQVMNTIPASLGPCVYLETGLIPQYKINLEIYQKNPQLCLSYFGI